MSKLGKIDIGSVQVGKFPIQAVYVGSILVWEEPNPSGQGLACFSCGYWEDTLPWVDTEVWVDNIL